MSERGRVDCTWDAADNTRQHPPPTPLESTSMSFSRVLALIPRFARILCRRSRLVEFDLCLSLRRKPSRREKGKDVEYGTRMARCTAERTKDTVPVVVMDLIYENLRLRDRAQREARVTAFFSTSKRSGGGQVTRRTASARKTRATRKSLRRRDGGRVADSEDTRRTGGGGATAETERADSKLVGLDGRGGGEAGDLRVQHARAEQEKCDKWSFVTARRVTTRGSAMWGQSWRAYGQNVRFSLVAHKSFWRYIDCFQAVGGHSTLLRLSGGTPFFRDPIGIRCDYSEDGYPTYHKFPFKFARENWIEGVQRQTEKSFEMKRFIRLGPTQCIRSSVYNFGPTPAISLQVFRVFGGSLPFKTVLAAKLIDDDFTPASFLLCPHTCTQPLKLNDSLAIGSCLFPIPIPLPLPYLMVLAWMSYLLHKLRIFPRYASREKLVCFRNGSAIVWIWAIGNSVLFFRCRPEASEASAPTLLALPLSPLCRQFPTEFLAVFLPSRLPPWVFGARFPFKQNVINAFLLQTLAIKTESSSLATPALYLGRVKQC
ncbi:hypothetical protein B0H16DRAFT_1467104 [Mycena metata]|uniref:Uncharacterized protein n=1 Tax=Mycena metata TaxID=1033252 RepID=A0AAD7I5M3_9AGAR|nr:hypothetical protein B0H16DRAFT_1467104 [Mycena metata]